MLCLYLSPSSSPPPLVLSSSSSAGPEDGSEAGQLARGLAQGVGLD